MNDAKKNLKNQIHEFQLSHFGENYVGISETGDLVTLDGRFSSKDLREIADFLDKIQLFNKQLNNTDSG